MLHRWFAGCGLTLGWLRLVGILSGGLLGLAAQAQDPSGTTPYQPLVPANWGQSCFMPDSMWHLSTDNRNTSPAAVLSSVYGNAFTPRGDMRILVIYAGLSDDNVDPAINPTLAASIVGNTANHPKWPQTDAQHPIWGTALPVNAYNDEAYFTDYNQFGTNPQKKSLSNFYYQMSQNSPNGAFRVIAEPLPNRVNVPFDPNLPPRYDPRSGTYYLDFSAYTARV